MIFIRNDYEFVPKPKGKDNIIINVKEDAFKDISDKNSTALLQEIVEQLHEIRASESVSQGLFKSDIAVLLFSLLKLLIK